MCCVVIRLNTYIYEYAKYKHKYEIVKFLKKDVIMLADAVL